MLKETAVRHFGSKIKLARALGVTKGAISNWGDVVPEGSAYKLEVLTKRVLRVDPQLYRKPTARSASNISAHSS
jgi:hypothetical protein